MFRGTLTLLARSLREDSRQRKSHAFRFLSIGIVFWLLVAAHINTGGIGAPGLRFYELICLLCFGLITLAGAGYFSSAITEEKEAGTLSLLLLANVPPLAILVGKSTTRLASALLIFAGIFPFALLALALGGVTVLQIVAGFLALAAYMVFVANLGVLASVISRTSGMAALTTALILVVMLFTPSVAPVLATSLVRAGWIVPKGTVERGMRSVSGALEEISPLTQFERTMQTGFDASPWGWQATIHVVLGVVLFGLAALMFRRFCEYLPEDVPGRAGAGRARGGRRGRWRRFWAPRAWRHALVWKDFQFLAGGVPGLLIRAALFPLLAMLLYYSDDILFLSVRVSLSDALMFLLPCLVAIETVAIAARVFHSEYRWHTLPTLALLPRSTAYLCATKILGCSLAFLPAAGWLVVLIVISPFSRWLTTGDVLSRWVLWTCILAVLAHLTAYLSLVVKWGALPLAVGILLILTTCASPFVAAAAAFSRAASGEREAVIAPLLYLTLMICGSLQIATGLRFRRAAAD